MCCKDSILNTVQLLLGSLSQEPMHPLTVHCPHPSPPGEWSWLAPAHPPLPVHRVARPRGPKVPGIGHQVCPDGAAPLRQGRAGAHGGALQVGPTRQCTCTCAVAHPGAPQCTHKTASIFSVDICNRVVGNRLW